MNQIPNAGTSGRTGLAAPVCGAGQTLGQGVSHLSLPPKPPFGQKTTSGLVKQSPPEFGSKDLVSQSWGSSVASQRLVGTDADPLGLQKRDQAQAGGPGIPVLVSAADTMATVSSKDRFFSSKHLGL